MAEELPIQRVGVSIAGAPPVQQREPASGSSILRRVVCRSFQPFLEALRSHEVASLKSESLNRQWLG